MPTAGDVDVCDGQSLSERLMNEQVWKRLLASWSISVGVAHWLYYVAIAVPGCNVVMDELMLRL